MPACTGPAYGMTRLVEQSDFCADLLSALAAEGVDVDQIHPEYSTGPYEVSVGALDPVAAADRSVLVRQTIRAVAQRHGLRVSFSPTVAAEGVGNGGHLHLSMWRDAVNVHAAGTGRYGMTPEAESFVAGIVAELPALAAVATPSPVSYLRLQPSHWAGVFAGWGYAELGVRRLPTATRRGPAACPTRAGSLRCVHPHVHLDVGLALHYVGPTRTAAVLAEAAALAPFGRLLYSSDAYAAPELYHLGALTYRRALTGLLTERVATGEWSAADAVRIATMVGHDNAVRVYGLDRADGRDRVGD